MKSVVSASLLLYAASLVGCQSQASTIHLGSEDRLSFNPRTAHHNERVRVSYDPTPILAADSVLVLRAVYRSNNDLLRGFNKTTVRTIAVLRRGDDRIFRGEFVYPQDADLVRVAVASIDSTRADGNSGTHWTLLAHGPTNRPLVESLSIAVWDLVQRNAWDEALSTAERLTELYPASPAAWFHQVAAEMGVVGESDFATRLPRYENKLRQLDASFTRSSPTPNDVALMYWLSFQVGDTSRASKWRRRLLKDFRRHPLAVQEQASEIAAREQAPAITLRQLDSLASAAPGHALLPVMVLSFARKVGDSSTIRASWTNAVRRSAYAEHAMARMLSETRKFEKEGLRLLERMLADADAGRVDLNEVDATLASVQPSRRELQRELLMAIGDARTRLKDSSGALTAYGRAADLEWSPTALSAARTLAQSRGDTARASRYALRLIADPLLSAVAVDSLRQLHFAHVDSAGFVRLLAGARDDMKRLLPSTELGTFDVRSFAVSKAGSELKLSKLLTPGSTAIVAVWGRGCPGARDDQPKLAALEKRARSLGISLLVTTPELESPELHAYIAAEPAFPTLYHDSRNALRQRFSAFGLPWYFVIDAGGPVLYRGTSLETAAAYAVAQSP